MNFNFGNNIKTLRKQRNLSQEQLAEVLSVSSQAISKWETGGSYPDISLLPIIADYFGISIDVLLGYDMSMREENIKAYYEQAEKLFEKNAYAEAVSLMREALLKYPGNDRLMYQLAWALSGMLSESKENYDEAITLYLKILEISTDTEIRARVTRDLVYRYYTKERNDLAVRYAKQLPEFAVCQEFIMGRSNVLEGRELSEYLQKNIQLFGGALMECLEYFQNTVILSSNEMNPYTPEDTKKKMALLKEILG